jgi:hypothetical protein
MPSSMVAVLRATEATICRGEALPPMQEGLCLFQRGWTLATLDGLRHASPTHARESFKNGSGRFGLFRLQ